MSRIQLLRRFTEPVRRFWVDESGAIISSELVLVGTIGVLGMTAGLSSVASSVNQELNDFGNAIGALNQSYSIGGFRGTSRCANVFVSGSSFTDSGNGSRIGAAGGTSLYAGGGQAADLVGSAGVVGVASVPGVAVVGGPVIAAIADPGVKVMDVCSGIPVTVQDIRAPKSTSITVTITDVGGVLHIVPNSAVQIQGHTNCAKCAKGAATEKEPPVPLPQDADDADPSKKKEAPPATKEGPESIPTPQSPAVEPAPSREPPKTKPKTEIPKPQADR